MSKTKSRSSSKKSSRPVKGASKPSKGTQQVKKVNKPIVKAKVQAKGKAASPARKAVKQEAPAKRSSVVKSKSSGKVSRSQPKVVAKSNRPIKKAKIEVKSEPTKKTSVKKAQTKVATSTPKQVPRESTIDYLKYFASKITEYEKKNKNVDSRQGQAYNLYEDLKIFTSLKTSQNLNRDVNQIKVKVLRSSEGIRDRYSLFLTYITAADYQSIYDHIQKNGLNGFLTFEKSGQGKALRSVSLTQPKDTAKRVDTTQRASTTGAALPQQQQFNNFFNINAGGGFQGLQQTMANMMQQMFNPTANKENLDNVNIDILSKKDKKDLNREEEQLSVMAQAFAYKNSKEPREVLQLLHQCSGNIETLESYFDQNQQHLAWDEEEDRVLRSINNTESQQFKNLQKAKGLDSIKQRVNYLGLRLNV